MARFNVIRGCLGLALLVLAACATSGQAARGSTNVLTREEISAAGVSNLLEAVERLRPRWLQARGPRSINSETRVLVFVDRSNLGGPEALSQFDAKNLVQLKYLDAAQAYATLSLPRGTAVQGAIVVELVTRSPQ